MDDALAPILDVTYGCLVYQEQVMQIVRDLGGYSYGRSDLVRRAMSKKKMDVMLEEKEYFIHGKLDNEGNVEIQSIKFCLDNDEPGRKATDTLMEKYYGLGYDVEDCPPPKAMAVNVGGTKNASPNAIT